MHRKMFTDAEAAPNSGTAPVACNVSWKRLDDFLKARIAA
jgi:hypothetical protein